MRVAKLTLAVVAVFCIALGMMGADAYTPRTGEFQAGYYVIASAQTGNVLTVDFEACAQDGAGIYVWEYQQYPCQEWAIYELGEGLYSIVNRMSDKALTVDWSGVHEAGTGLIQWYGLEYPNQLWRLRAVDEETYIIQSVESELCLTALFLPVGEYDLPPYGEISQGEFTEDATQHWYLRLVEGREG